MVYYSENNCYMRVGFTESDNYNVVNVEYKSTTGNENGVNYQLLAGENATFITDNPNGLGYKPEDFLWLWKDSLNPGTPYYTTDPDFKPENIYKVDDFKEIKLDQLTEDYLGQFYESDEPDYISFVNSITHKSNQSNQDSLSIQNSQNTQPDQNNQIATVDTTKSGITLHLIIVANTLISNIGTSCAIDKKNFQSQFEGVAQALKINIKEYFVCDSTFSKQNLLNQLQAVVPGFNDIIVFLYTGHGFRYEDQTDSFPNFSLCMSDYQEVNESSSIRLISVYNILAKKGARLTIVLSNCCNSTAGLNQVASSSLLSSKANQNFDETNLSKLMLNAGGTILATAASPGEFAWCNHTNGSFFVNSFLQSFRQEISILNKDTDWQRVIGNTILNAEEVTSTSCASCQAQKGLMSVKVSQ